MFKIPEFSLCVESFFHVVYILIYNQYVDVEIVNTDLIYPLRFVFKHEVLIFIENLPYILLKKFRIAAFRYFVDLSGFLYGSMIHLNSFFF